MTSAIDLDMATGIVGEPVTADNTSRDLLTELGDDLLGVPAGAGDVVARRSAGGWCRGCVSPGRPRGNNHARP